MNSRKQLPDILLFLFAGAGIFLAGSGLLCLLASSLDDVIYDPELIHQPYMGISAMLALILCGLPALYWSLRGFLQGQSFHTRQTGKALPITLGLLLILVLAIFMQDRPGINDLLLQPLINIVLAITTAALTIQIALYYAPGLSQRRFWGQFLTGLYGIAPIIILLEFFALLPFIFLFTASLMFGETSEQFMHYFYQPGLPDTGLWQQFDPNLVLQPEHFFLLLIYLALVVPLIEELLKSAAIWPWLGRGLTDAEAYLGGILAGSGYGLFEAILLTQPGELWFETAITRIGATFLHAATAGFSSLFIARAFRRKKAWQAIPAYLLAVLIHGLWNANAILSTGSMFNFNPQLAIFAPESNVPAILSSLLFVLLSLLSAFSLGYFGRRLKPADNPTELRSIPNQTHDTHSDA